MIKRQTPSQLLKASNEWNNEGASLMLNGSFDDAITYLTQALVSCQEALRMSDVEESRQGQHEEREDDLVNPVDHGTVGEHDDTDSVKRVPSMNEFPVFGPPLEGYNDILKDYSTPSAMFQHNPRRRKTIYQRPIVILESHLLPTKTRFPVNRSKLALDLSMAIIFNLALYYQLSAEQNEDETPATWSKTNANYRRAAKLYEQAYVLGQRGERFEGCRQLSISPVVFTTAILNNLGHVYTSLKECEASTMCFNGVLTTLMCLLDRNMIVDEDHETDFDLSSMGMTRFLYEGFLRGAGLQLRLFDASLPASAA